MANTQSIDALRPELWQKVLMKNKSDMSFLSKFMGEGENNIIQVKNDLKKYGLGNTNFSTNYGSSFVFNNIPYFYLKGYRFWLFQFPFSEMLFFPSKLSSQDINTIQDYYSNKYGSHFAAQTPYTP